MKPCVKKPHPKEIVYLAFFAFFAVIGWLLMSPVWTALTQYNSYKSEFFARYSAASSVSAPRTPAASARTGLVFDLIDADVRNGITGAETAQLARRNVSAYLDDVAEKCHTGSTDRQNEAFVACAGHLVSQHFYYYPGAAVTAGYAHHSSDCDASTYLMMTAAATAGLPAWIMYAPRHAFFTWKDSFGNHRYWETTDRNNRGKPASLNDSLYEKTVSTAYYSPRDSAFAEKLYQAVIYSGSDDRRSLESSLAAEKDNHLISDALLYEKAFAGRLTRSDVGYLESGLQEDFTSNDRKMALGRYWLDHHDAVRASGFLSLIGPDDCKSDCVLLRAEAGRYFRIIAPFYMFFDTLFTLNGGAFSLAVFYWTVPSVISLLIALFFAVLFLRLLFRRKPGCPVTDPQKHNEDGGSGI